MRSCARSAMRRVGLAAAARIRSILQTETNKRFVAAMKQGLWRRPGILCRGPLRQRNGHEAGSAKDGRQSPTTRPELMKALRSVTLTDTPRGQIKFDQLRQCDRQLLRAPSRESERETHQQNGENTYKNVESVLDLRRKEIPRATGLFAKLSTAQVVIAEHAAGAARRRGLFN